MFHLLYLYTIGLLWRIQAKSVTRIFYFIWVALTIYGISITMLNTKEEKQAFKRACIAYKGGKCIRCGYDKSIRSLHFHHRDPSIKESNIASLFRRALELPIVELDKCDLVCANCHGEIHDEA